MTTREPTDADLLTRFRAGTTPPWAGCSSGTRGRCSGSCSGCSGTTTRPRTRCRRRSSRRSGTPTPSTRRRSAGGCTPWPTGRRMLSEAEGEAAPAAAEAEVLLGLVGGRRGRPGADRADDARAVRELLAALPAAQRAVILLRVYEGMKFREVAERARVPAEHGPGPDARRVEEAAATVGGPPCVRRPPPEPTPSADRACGTRPGNCRRPRPPRSRPGWRRPGRPRGAGRGGPAVGRGAGSAGPGSGPAGPRRRSANGCGRPCCRGCPAPAVPRPPARLGRRRRRGGGRADRPGRVARRPAARRGGPARHRGLGPGGDARRGVPAVNQLAVTPDATDEVIRRRVSRGTTAPRRLTPRPSRRHPAGPSPPTRRSPSGPRGDGYRRQGQPPARRRAALAFLALGSCVRVTFPGRDKSVPPTSRLHRQHPVPRRDRPLARHLAALGDQHLLCSATVGQSGPAARRPRRPA